MTTSTVYIGKLYECTPSGCSRYVFAGDQRIAIKDATGMHYYHTDHLGSSTVITDGAGALYQALAYAPYGQIRSNSRSDAGMHHKYTGQERDDSTGLDFYNARYYASGLHRFVSPDTIVQNFADPQSLNRYAYVRNNPLRYIDPSGQSWLGDFFHKTFGNTFDNIRDHSEVWGVALQFFSPMPFLGTALLMQSEHGRDILGGEVLAATAAATWACGGCGIAVGALMGESFGAIGSIGTGGNLLTGVAIGGLAGAVGGAAGAWAGGLDTFTGAVTAGATGGLTQGMGYKLANGGSWREAWRAGYQGALIGAAIGAATWGLNEIYREWSSYSYNDETGVLTRVGPKNASIIPRYENVFGRVESWCEPGSSLCSTIGNYILPGGNSTGWGHDGLYSFLRGVQGWSPGAANYPTMIYGYVMTVGAAAREFPSAPLTLDQDK